HIGMRRRYGWMREGARRFSRPYRRIDPSLVEKPAGDLGHLWSEAAISAEHGRLGFVPRHAAGVFLGQRRIAVPVFELGLAEPFRLHGIVAMRELWIGGAHRFDQCVDHFRFDAVRKMA